MGDLSLRENVLNELEFEPSINAAHIGVAVDNGVVTLSGHVGSYAEKLMADGLSPATPVAVIEKATRPDQRVLRSLLADLGQMVDRHRVKSPALIVVGDVASLAQALDCLPHHPLEAIGAIPS